MELWVGAGAFVVVLLAWLAVTGLGLVQPQFLPSPQAVLSAWIGLFGSADYLGDIGISVARVWIAFLASAVVAIPLGMLMSSYRAIGAFTEPLVDFVRYLPVPALVPLTLIWLGIGEGSKIALLWIGTFFQLVLLVADDARRVPKEFIETGRTLGAGDRALMTDVLVPGHAAQHGRQPAHHAGLVLDLPDRRRDRRLQLGHRLRALDRAALRQDAGGVRRHPDDRRDRPRLRPGDPVPAPALVPLSWLSAGR